MIVHLVVHLSVKSVLRKATPPAVQGVYSLSIVSPAASILIALATLQHMKQPHLLLSHLRRTIGKSYCYFYHTPNHIFVSIQIELSYAASAEYFILWRRIRMLCRRYSSIEIFVLVHASSSLRLSYAIRR